MFFTPSFSFAFLFLCVSTDLSSALQVTVPYEGFSWNGRDPLVVQWTSVQTDPTNFGIQISNNDPNTYPGSTNRMIATDVSAAAGRYTIQGNQGLKAGSGYQINLVGEQNPGILAQSARFSISGGSGNSDTSAPSVSDSNNSGATVTSNANPIPGDLSNGYSNTTANGSTPPYGTSTPYGSTTPHDTTTPYGTPTPSGNTPSAGHSSAQILAVFPVQIAVACLLMVSLLHCV